MDQTVLYNALMEVQSNITRQLEECCNASLEKIEKAKEQSPEDDQGGRPYWLYGMLGVACVVVFVSPIACYLGFRGRRYVYSY